LGVVSIRFDVLAQAVVSVTTVLVGIGIISASSLIIPDRHARAYYGYQAEQLGMLALDYLNTVDDNWLNGRRKLSANAGPNGRVGYFIHRIFTAGNLSKDGVVGG